VLKTIKLKNTGILNLPKGTYLREVDSKIKIQIPELEVSKEHQCIVKIYNTKKVTGKYETNYQIWATNDFGVEEAIGEFTLQYELVQRVYSDDIINKAK